MRETTADAERMFREAGAVMEGHFLLTSGLHSPVYWEKFGVLEQPRFTERLCRMIATHFQGQTSTGGRAHDRRGHHLLRGG